MKIIIGRAEEEALGWLVDGHGAGRAGEEALGWLVADPGAGRDGEEALGWPALSPGAGLLYYRFHRYCYYRFF